MIILLDGLNQKMRLGYTLILLILLQTISFADPTCPCDDEFDPSTDPVGYFECVEEKCSGVNIPISDNLWLLVVFGASLAFFTIKLNNDNVVYASYLWVFRKWKRERVF